MCCAARHFRLPSALQMASTLSQTSENPLLRQEGLPLFRSIAARHVVPAISTLIMQLKTDFDELESQLSDGRTASFENTIEHVERIKAPLEYAWGVVGHLMG
jgi:Zn-dependent oligopeptidase